MTVPPNYSVPPEYPPPPQGGYPYGSGYGGAPGPEDRGRSGWIVGGIVIGCTMLLLGSILLAAFLVNQDEKPSDDPVVASSVEQTPSEEPPSPSEDPTTAEADEYLGQCLPYAPQVSGGGVDTLPSCDDAAAFWTITAWSDDLDATVDDDGVLNDNEGAYEVCGVEYGAFVIGALWTDWYYVYDSASGKVDDIYCIEALGNPDDDGRTPYMPDTGDCFDESDEWWTVPCDSAQAVYEVVGKVEFHDPRQMSDDEASSEAAECGGEHYWKIDNLEGQTTSILCGIKL